MKLPPNDDVMTNNSTAESIRGKKRLGGISSLKKLLQISKIKVSVKISESNLNREFFFSTRKFLT